MNESEKTLWQRIAAFELNDPAADLVFTERLARENGWTRDFARSATEEYKRFILLCCISPHGVTPSDVVDQVWHLHLTYTQSYWNDFCKKTIGKEIHHNPTRGGTAEQNKFADWYTETLQLYEQTFSEKPPADIWPDPQQRFTDIDFVRANKRTHFLLRKPGSKAWRGVGMGAFVCLSFGLASGNIWAGLALGLPGGLLVANIKSGPSQQNGGCNGVACGSGCSSDSGCSSGCGGGCGGGCGS
jgi:hypothetical protein